MNERNLSAPPEDGGPGHHPAWRPSGEPSVAVALPAPPHASERTETLHALTRRGVPGYELVTSPTDGIEPVLRTASARLVLAWTSDPDAPGAIAHARAAEIPVCVIHDAGRDAPFALPGDAAATLLRRCAGVLSPTQAGDRQLTELGIDPGRIARWRAGIDPERFGPGRYCASAIEPAPGAARPVFPVLAAEPVLAGPELTLLLEAFWRAGLGNERLQLVMAGGGPAERELRAALGGRLVVVDPADANRLAAAFASAELFVSVSGAAYGVLQAQASGVAALAVEGSGGAELIAPGRSGCLVAPDPDALAGAIRGLARRATLRERLATGGLLVASGRSWEAALGELAAHWDAILRPAAGLAQAA